MSINEKARIMEYAYADYYKKNPSVADMRSGMKAAYLALEAAKGGCTDCGHAFDGHYRHCKWFEQPDGCREAFKAAFDFTKIPPGIAADREHVWDKAWKAALAASPHDYTIDDAYNDACKLAGTNRVTIKYRGAEFTVSPHRLGKKVQELESKLKRESGKPKKCNPGTCDFQPGIPLMCCKNCEEFY